MNNLLNLAKLFVVDYNGKNSIGLFPPDIDDNEILMYIKENNEELRNVLSSKETKDNIVITSHHVSACRYSLVPLDHLPQEFVEKIVFH